MNVTQSEIKYLRSLQQKKYRDREHKFLLEGWHPLREALNSDFHIELIVVQMDLAQKSEYQLMLKYAKERRIPIKELRRIHLIQISDTVHSQGVVALIRQPEKPFDPTILMSANFIVACDHVSDPGNLGTILRTCDWFAVDGVLLSEGCVSLYNEKVLRSTAGSIFHLKVFEELNFEVVLSKLKADGMKIVATNLDGKPLNSFAFSERALLLLGSEAHGVDPKLLQYADEVLSIPRYGHAESLNVGIACGIFLAQWRNQVK